MNEDRPSDRLSVSLREYLELEIAHLREVLTGQLEHEATALRLQAKEYERRLEDLNGERSRSLEDRAGYVQMDAYTTFIANDAAWKHTTEGILATFQRDYVTRANIDDRFEGVNGAIEDLRKTRDRTAGGLDKGVTDRTTMLALGGLVVGVAAILARLFGL